MNARTQNAPIRGAQPQIDTKLYEDNKKDLELAIKLAKSAKDEAEGMLDVMHSKLNQDLTNIDVQGQVLKLRDYIFNKANIISQLEGQLYETNKVLESAKKQVDTVN